MIALASALFLSALQAAPDPKPFRDAVELFTRVCTRGGDSFARDMIEAIPAIDVESVRADVGEQRHNRYYRVRPGRWDAFLIIQDTIAEADPRNLRYCTVATRSLGFRAAVRRVFPGRDPPRGRRSGRAMFVHDSPLGHRINIEGLRDGYVSITSIVPGPEAIRDEDILFAFRNACDRSHGSYAIAAKGGELGWEEIPDSAHPHLQRLMRAIAEGGDRLNVRAFRRPIGGRPVFALVAEGADGSAGPGTRCRLYDFDATGAVDLHVVERWTRPNPVSARDLAEGGAERLLTPDWDKHASVQVLHVPANSALAQQYGFSGNLFAAHSLGDP